MPDFTKRHYETIALVLHSSNPDAAPNDPAYVQWQRTCLAFINHFRNDNPGFKAQQFMTACTGEKHGRSKR